MSSLSVYHVPSPDLPNKVLTHFEDIASTLAEHGVRFERWQAATKIQPGASHEEMIDAYREPVDKLMTERGFRTVDVVSQTRDDAQNAESRGIGLDEHRYDEDVVRFFVAGRGLFSLHVDDYVYAVLCERNDLIVIPAGTPHWFDMGEHPHFIAIRLSNHPEGGIRTFTGDDIASQFPRLED